MNKNTANSNSALKKLQRATSNAMGSVIIALNLYNFLARFA